MNLRNKAVVLLLVLSAAGFAVFSQIDPQDEALHLTAFMAAGAFLSVAIALIFGISWKRKDILIDGETHRVLLISPLKRLEYFQSLGRGKRLHVYVERDSLKAVEEHEKHMDNGSFWEASSESRVASALEARIYDQLFSPC